jgi:hypothetical protein
LCPFLSSFFLFTSFFTFFFLLRRNKIISVPSCGGLKDQKRLKKKKKEKRLKDKRAEQHSIP